MSRTKIRRRNGPRRSATEALRWASWPEPQLVPRARPPVPAFNSALLPDSLAPWVADVADRVQCPPDFVAVGVLVAAAAVIGRKVAIRPKRQDDWAVVPNLWGLAVGPPGLMKSPALAEALRPLHRLVTDAHAQYEEQRLVHHFHLAEQKARRHDLAQRLRAAVAHEESTEDLREPFAAVSRYTPRTERRYLVNDTTVEKLGDLLNHNPNGLLLFRDELSGFLHTMDRPGHENDRAFYCEAWNGTGAYTYDRIGRGTLHIRAACVSVLGGIQPGPLERYLREAFGGHGDDGLIQRFQLAVWPDVVGRWRNVDRWPDADARTRVVEVFQRLHRLEPAALGAEELTPEALPFLRFQAEAQELFDAWRAALEQTLRAEEEHPVLLSHWAKYRSLMPALALIVHLIDAVDAGTSGPVARAAAERATAWCTYLEAHARRLYALITDAARVAAAVLATKITHGRLASPFTARDVYRNELAPKEEADVLERYYDVDEVGQMPSTPGRNVLWIARTPEAIAGDLKIPVPRVTTLLEDGRKRLLEARNRRTTPYVEGTVFADRNGMMISAYLEAYKTLGREDVEGFALKSLDFLLANLREEGGSLFHAFSNGAARVPGFLSDYVWVARSALDAFQVTGEPRYLRAARELMDHALKRLWDPTGGGFFDIRPEPRTAEPLTRPAKTIDDGSTPSPNAIAAVVLDQLADLTNVPLYRQRAEQLLKLFAGSAASSGRFVSGYGLALDLHLRPPAHAVIIGPLSDARTRALWQATLAAFRPGKLVVVYDPARVKPADLPPPVVAAMKNSQAAGVPQAFVCVATTCSLPTSEPKVAASLVTTFERPGGRRR